MVATAVAAAGRCLLPLPAAVAAAAAWTLLWLLPWPLPWPLPLLPLPPAVEAAEWLR